MENGMNDDKENLGLQKLGDVVKALPTDPETLERVLDGVEPHIAAIQADFVAKKIDKETALEQMKEVYREELKKIASGA